MRCAVEGRPDRPRVEGKRAELSGTRDGRRPGAEDVHLGRSQEGDHQATLGLQGLQGQRVLGYMAGAEHPQMSTLPRSQTHPEHLERAGVPLPPEMFLYCPLLTKRNIMLTAQDFHP